MTRQEAVTLVGMLSAAYPKYEITRPTIRLYEDFLQDLPFDLARAAVAKHITTSTFFPTVAELREAALSMTDTAPVAADAWTEVLNEIARVGMYDKPNFSHPAIEKTVKAIGWRNLCMSEQIGVERAHFMRIYGDYRKRETENAKVLPVLQRLGIDTGKLFALPRGREEA